MNKIKDLLASLVRYESITPSDEGCQDLMIHILEKAGFQCERLNNPPVSNFFARYGTEAPLLLFAGHTDVVDIGDADEWDSNPFDLSDKNGMLYGRGSADMKGSLACMLIAASRFVSDHSDFSGSLGFLITSGEEGDHFDLGTPHVMLKLQQQGIKPDYCVIGEPSSTNTLGDVIKIGRRGSLTAKVTLKGKQGHVAYPSLAENPIHTISPALNELVNMQWDAGNEHFPPTTLQITHISSGGHGNNIIPGRLFLQFNFRYSTEQTADTLKKSVETCFIRHGLSPSIQWRLNGEPFLTKSGKLIEACKELIQAQTGSLPELSTSGGTSDGRFIAPYGVELIELGPINATIHQVNECVSLNDLVNLETMYHGICEKLLLK